jgi:hypothetical protein
MTKEEIHLIKGYLGHEVPCIVKNPYEQDGVKEFESDLDSLFLDSILYELDFKLILRPIEDLTDEELLELNKILEYDYISVIATEYLIKLIIENKELTQLQLEYFHKNHIDYQDLIGQGLAIKKEKE